MLEKDKTTENLLELDDSKFVIDEQVIKKARGYKMNKIKHKIVKVGIMSFDQFKKRTIAIAKGEYKPKKNEPKIWFHSIRSLAHVLSEENQALLKLIIETHPQSIKELEGVTGRTANNLLRTLRMMENYGFVKLREGESSRGRAPLVPEVIYSGAKVEVEFFKKI